MSPSFLIFSSVFLYITYLGTYRIQYVAICPLNTRFFPIPCLSVCFFLNIRSLKLLKHQSLVHIQLYVCSTMISLLSASLSVLLYVFDRFSPYSYQNNKEKYKDDDEKREFTFKECLWFCMTSLTPQVRLFLFPSLHFIV